MITEDYCSYEVSKLLKDKGFDGLCYCHEFTDYEGNFTTYHTEYPENWNQSEPCVSIPTLGMAMKWLREVHKVFISIDAYTANHWDGYIDTFEIDIFKNASRIMVPREIAIHNIYEEAVEAAIKYSLKNLI